MNTTDILGMDTYPIGSATADQRCVDHNNKIAYKELLGAKPMIPVIQIFDWAFYNLTATQEMRSMSWQAFVGGGKGLMLYSTYEIIQMDKITPLKDRWKDVIQFTDEIWKYKDVILSIEKVNKIEYIQNNNVSFRQWKFNKTNYITVCNLEKYKEIFKIDLLDKYKVYKELGLGKMEKNGTQIIFYLEPIDVMIIKYADKSESKSNFVIIFVIIIIVIIFIIVIVFIAQKYFMKKYKTKTFIDSVSKLMND